MRFAIRAATARDYDALLPIFEEVDALHREHLPHLFQKARGAARDRAYLLDMLCDRSCGLFVAQAEAPAQRHAEGQLLGFVQVTIRDTPPLALLVPRRVANVENLAVREGFRRAGIGRALMHRAQSWAGENRADEIELTVYAFNQAAISFYESLGYATTSHRLSKRLG